VIDDLFRDKLMGGAGFDWFFASKTLDRTTDLLASGPPPEQVVLY
jgi:hypothetical protein